MKYCEEYAALLDAFVDGELSAEEASCVREHLRDCDGCATYVENALALRAAFPDVDSIEVPPGFADGVCAAIRANAAPRKRSRRWIKVAASFAACAAIVFAASRIMPKGNQVATFAASGAESSGIAESRSTDIPQLESELPMEFADDSQESTDNEGVTAASPSEIPDSVQIAKSNPRTARAQDNLQTREVVQTPIDNNLITAPPVGIIAEVASEDIAGNGTSDLSSLEFHGQALETIQPEAATYDERLKTLDDLVKLHFLFDSEFQTTAHTENGSAIAWYGKIPGTPQMDSYTLYLSFADGSVTQLPLPQSDAMSTAAPGSMWFEANTFVYELTFADDLPDETSQNARDFIHVKGTYRYCVDLDAKTISLEIQ